MQWVLYLCWVLHKFKHWGGFLFSDPSSVWESRHAGWDVYGWKHVTCCLNHSPVEIPGGVQIDPHERYLLAKSSKSTNWCICEFRETKKMKLRARLWLGESPVVLGLITVLRILWMWCKACMSQLCTLHTTIHSLVDHPKIWDPDISQVSTTSIFFRLSNSVFFGYNRCK